MSASDILFSLQDKVIKKFNKLKVDITEEELEEMLGPGFVNQYSRDGSSTDEDPSAVDVPYITHRPIPEPKGKKAGSNYVPFGEAKEKPTDEEQMESAEDMEADVDAVEADAAAGEEDVDAADVAADDELGTDVGGDMMDGSMGADDMGGMGMEQEEPKSSSEIGRIYELKKIYARLTSIESYLGNESDTELLQIRNHVSQSIELFELVSSNFDSYKEKLDEIIVTYYKFLLEVYESVKKIYAQQAKSGDK